MKKSILFILFSFSMVISFGKSAPAFFSYKSDGFCKLVALKKSVYCITKSAIYKEEKSELKQLIILTSACNSAVANGDKIWLATEAGIVSFDSRSGTLSPILPEAIKGKITHIETDEFSNIWFTKEWEGCFKIDSLNSIQQIVKVPVTYSLTHTSDSNMWVGTNVGLYKVPVSGKEIVRYAEEGIADNDLPDNLVEQLYGTGSSVWAIMPGHISHITPGEDDAPDFENIGNRDNELYDITQIPLQSQSFLFATKQGILYLPNVQNDERFRLGEIHQEVKETAFHLNDDAIRKPGTAKNEPVTSICFINEKAYFVTMKGYWSIPVSSLLKQLKSK